MKFFTVIPFVFLGACAGNAVTESEILDLKVIQTCVSALHENGSDLVQSPNVLVAGYQDVRVGHCSLCPSISVAFGDFLNPSPVDPSYISDKMAPSCSVDKETLKVVYLMAPKKPHRRELVEYVEPNLSLAEEKYNELLELSKNNPNTTVKIVERIYSYSQGKWKKRTEKLEERLLKDFI